jgi:hypothetical protein
MKKRRRFKQTLSLEEREERLAEDSAQLRERAIKMKPGSRALLWITLKSV